MIRKPLLLTVAALSVLVLGVTGATAQQTQSELAVANGECVAGGTYDPACDVDHNGVMNVVDLELVASHWNQTGVWMSDADHDHLGQTWTGNNNPLRIGGTFGGVGYAPLVLSNSNPLGAGLRIDSAAYDGVYVSSAGRDGVYVESAGDDGLTANYADDDGVSVGSAGNPTARLCSSAKNGFEICGAEDHGLYVGQADQHGILVNSATKAGFRVENAGGNGLYVVEAGNHGVDIGNAVNDGIHVTSAGNLAGYFNGNVSITGTCSNCTQAIFARNASATSLEPGDVVAVRGIAHTAMQNAPVVVEVDQAAGRDAVIGVVRGWAEVVEDGDKLEGGVAQRLVPREKPAQPGEYVSIIIDGLAQAKASALSGVIQEGTRLTAATEPGHVRAVKTVDIQGVEVAENTPILGIALEGLEAGQNLIWVLVNPR